MTLTTEADFRAVKILTCEAMRRFDEAHTLASREERVSMYEAGHGEIMRWLRSVLLSSSEQLRHDEFFLATFDQHRLRLLRALDRMTFSERVHSGLGQGINDAAEVRQWLDRYCPPDGG